MSTITIENNCLELEKNDLDKFNKSVNELWEILEKKEFDFHQIEEKDDLYEYNNLNEWEYSFHDSIELNSNFTILDFNKDKIKLLVYSIAPPIGNSTEDMKWYLSIEQFYELICNIENNITFEKRNIEKNNIISKKDFSKIKMLLKEIIEYKNLQNQKKIWLWKKLIKIFINSFKKITEKVLGKT